MSATDLYNRLVEDVEHAIEALSSSPSLGQVMNKASSHSGAGDIKTFTAQAWIATSGLTFGGYLSQLGELVYTRPSLEQLKGQTDLTYYREALKNNKKAFIDAFEYYVSGDIVMIGADESGEDFLTDILDTIHQDAESIYQTYLNILKK